LRKGLFDCEKGSITLIAEGLEINLDDNSGVFREVFFFDAKTEAYITAREVRRVPEGHFIGYDCTFTTCNPEQPAWEIRGSTVHYYPENYSSAISTSLRVRGVPIFLLPLSGLAHSHTKANGSTTTGVRPTNLEH
jgi:lipopolysaccharide assembly outer membrane protein LptD (OstA)